MKFVSKGAVLLVLVGGVASFGFWAWASFGAPHDDVAYRTANVDKGDLAGLITATGTIEPEEVIDVGVQVAGQIKHFGPDPRDPGGATDLAEVFG